MPALRVAQVSQRLLCAQCRPLSGRIRISASALGQCHPARLAGRIEKDRALWEKVRKP